MEPVPRYVYIPESGFGPMCTDMNEAYRLTCKGLEQALRRRQMLIDAGLWPAPEEKPLHTREVHITKSERGWSILTIQHWADFPAAQTTSSEKTLYWAIYKAVSWAANRYDTKVTVLTVNGQPYPRDKAVAAIQKATEGILAYSRDVTIAALAI